MVFVGFAYSFRFRSFRETETRRSEKHVGPSFYGLSHVLSLMLIQAFQLFPIGSCAPSPLCLSLTADFYKWRVCFWRSRCCCTIAIVVVFVAAVLTPQLALQFRWLNKRKCIKIANTPPARERIRHQLSWHSKAAYASVLVYLCERRSGK